LRKQLTTEGDQSEDKWTGDPLETNKKKENGEERDSGETGSNGEGLLVWEEERGKFPRKAVEVKEI